MADSTPVDPGTDQIPVWEPKPGIYQIKMVDGMTRFGAVYQDPVGNFFFAGMDDQVPWVMFNPATGNPSLLASKVAKIRELEYGGGLSEAIYPGEPMRIARRG